MIFIIMQDMIYQAEKMEALIFSHLHFLILCKKEAYL